MNEFLRLEQLVGETVILQADDAHLPATLSAARWIGSGRTAALSVLFEAESTEPLVQQVFRVTGDRVGEMDLFLVPIGPGEAGMVYEAVINVPQAATP